MIKYILKCNNKHEFESWFSNSSEFEKLEKKKLIECIFCNSTKVKKSMMSPQISNFKKENKNTIDHKNYYKIKKDLINMRKFVEKNFEFVGDKLSSKVRDIYYDKSKKKNIYGTATTKEKEELKEEGIELSTIPWLDKDN
ncbi:DUF1178 family protein [Pelagibacteraceae bacterium]|jgi:hypothetical protein|nr:DUF1178 family protein [Pelagibacteraceae bacterium]|tara:strand:+ start:3168 stop:3587 length:420 start_codon:yes stop_codon:yes gene_type:complete